MVDDSLLIPAVEENLNCLRAQAGNDQVEPYDGVPGEANLPEDMRSSGADKGRDHPRAS